MLPFACLIVGDAVLGAEVRSGAFALTWLSPTPFATIVAGPLAGRAGCIAAVALAPAMALAAARRRRARRRRARSCVATVAAAGAYIALFVLIGASVQRAALWSLGHRAARRAAARRGPRRHRPAVAAVAGPHRLRRARSRRRRPAAQRRARRAPAPSCASPSSPPCCSPCRCGGCAGRGWWARRTRPVAWRSDSNRSTSTCTRSAPSRTSTSRCTSTSSTPTSGVGGFFRVGNRPNEGTGEMTVCLYLPDGRVGFMFKRPEVTSNDAFDSAGLRFTVVEPFEELTVTYDGKVVLLDDPLQLADPKAAFTSNPYAEAEVAPHLHAGVRHVRRRARHAAREAGRGVRQGPLRAARRRHGLDPGRRRGVGDRRLRPARPLVGPAVLAGALVLPVAHRQRRARLRVHGQPHRPPRRRGHPGRLRVAGRASCTCATTAS